MELIDTHCHLDVESFDADRPTILAQCRSAGITRIVIPAIHAAGWNKLLQLCHQDAGLYPALGLHPVYIESHQDADLLALEQKLREEKPLAVGEIGLDFFLTELDRQRQQTIFEAQLQLAQDARLPVLLHVRKAHDQVLATLRRIRVKGGIAHAFNGSLQQAQQYLELGFKLGFGGTLTYDRSSKIRQLAQALPIEAIVLETDAPDMVVAQHRGERNSPEYLTHVLLALAELRQMDVMTLAQQTTANACEVLGIEIQG
ncbi:MAG: TatD family hydrolase [Gammaproteobacteria bacterium]